MAKEGMVTQKNLFSDVQNTDAAEKKPVVVNVNVALTDNDNTEVKKGSLFTATSEAKPIAAGLFQAPPKTAIQDSEKKKIDEPATGGLLKREKSLFDAPK